MREEIHDNSRRRSQNKSLIYTVGYLLIAKSVVPGGWVPSSHLGNGSLGFFLSVVPGGWVPSSHLGNGSFGVFYL